MPLLELLHTQTFDAEMDRLRMFCFPGKYPAGSSRDQFDWVSTHVVARAGGQLAGAGRLIPRPTAFYQHVFQGRLVVPDEPDVAYLGRLMVAPAYRGHDFFELLMVEGLLYASDAGFRLVFGGMHPNRRFRPFLEELGFRNYGAPQLGDFPEGNLHQPLVAETTGRRADWQARRHAVLLRLKEKGYEMKDGGRGAV